MEANEREDAARELLAAIVSLVADWTSAATQGGIARDVGLDIAEGDVRALYTIGLHGGAMRPGGLAAELRLSRPTTSKLIARLAASGLVLRRPDETDGRSASIELTERGALAYERLVGAGVRMVERALRGTTPAEAAALASVMRRLLVQGDGDGDPHPEG